MPAFLLSPLIRWAVVGVVMLALLGGLIWFKHEATLAKATATLATEDAKRWHVASDERDRDIKTMSDERTKVNAEIEAARSDNAKLDAINAKYAADMRATRGSVEAQIQETKNDARQRPAEVHRLGAVACAQYRRLYGADAACVDPQPAVAP